MPTKLCLQEAANKTARDGAQDQPATAMGGNVEIYNDEAGLQALQWANECVNHTVITKYQKQNEITSHQQQFGNEETLQTANGFAVCQPICEGGKATVWWEPRKGV